MTNFIFVSAEEAGKIRATIFASQTENDDLGKVIENWEITVKIRERSGK